MSSSVLYSLLSDCMLSVVLFFLFLSVARLSPTVHGIGTWGLAHLLYTLGTTLIDAITSLLQQQGNRVGAMFATNLGGMLACVGMSGLAWAVLQFVRQRALRCDALLWMSLAALLSALAWLLGGTQAAQSVPLSVVEISALAVVAWQLRNLRSAADRVPARLMMAASLALIAIYGSAVPGWFDGRFGIDDRLVSTDLALWFMLNFCMLILTSFHAAEALRRSALLDPLTGALNRRGLDQLLEERRTPDAARIPDGVAVLALDLDRFKLINDEHGHQTGDRVLQGFSDTVRRCIHQHDLFVRTGGEEFVVISAGLDCTEALQLAERIRLATERMQLPGHHGLQVGVSVGVACTAQCLPMPELMTLADQALYAAKRGGRNRVELYQPACASTSS